MSKAKRAHIRVGQSDGDIVGKTHVALQAAVDYVAGLGGGVVEIGPGEYEMSDSLHLRSGVTVRGHDAETVLKMHAGRITPLAIDGDYGEEQITLADPTGFVVGGGVTVGYDNPGNFHTTVAKLTAQIDEHTFAISTPLVNDYVVARGSKAQTTFPVISGYHVEGARVEHLSVDGNRANNPSLGGCRGAGVFLYRGHGAVISHVHVTGYHGDGISYQQSNDVLVEDCVVTHCADKGLHPGSGSQRTIVRRCRMIDNDQIGLFLCWRVRFSRFEHNEVHGSGVAGISIGHKDSDNVFLHNVVEGSGRYGVLFRKEVEALAGHRNRFESNRIVDNGDEEGGYGFYIAGPVHDVEITGNTIADTRPAAERKQRVGVFIDDEAGPVEIRGNEMHGHSEADVHPSLDAVAQ